MRRVLTALAILAVFGAGHAKAQQSNAPTNEGHLICLANATKLSSAPFFLDDTRDVFNAGSFVTYKEKVFFNVRGINMYYICHHTWATGVTTIRYYRDNGTKGRHVNNP